MYRKDLLTGEEFIPKKKSQKFASSQNRIKYHNQRANELREKRAYILGPLNKNHDILIALMENNRTIVTSDFLEGRGFDFSKDTHTSLIGDIEMKIVYDFCLLIIKGSRNIYISKINDKL